MIIEFSFKTDYFHSILIIDKFAMHHLSGIENNLKKTSFLYHSISPIKSYRYNRDKAIVWPQRWCPTRVFFSLTYSAPTDLNPKGAFETKRLSLFIKRNVWSFVHCRFVSDGDICCLVRVVALLSIWIFEGILLCYILYLYTVIG